MAIIYLVLMLYLLLHPFKLLLEHIQNKELREFVWYLILIFYISTHVLLTWLSLTTYIPIFLVNDHNIAVIVMTILFILSLSFSVIMLIMAKFMDKIQKKHGN